MLKVVFDTNVWVSALIFGGKPAQLIRLALRKEIAVMTSADLADELAGVLVVKFKYPARVVDAILQEFNSITVFCHPREKISVIHEDPADNRVLECAAASGATVIISGDKHLLNLKKFRNILIFSPHDFLMERGKKKR